MSFNPSLRRVAIALTLPLAVAGGSQADSIGMVVDRDSSAVIVFDADHDIVLGSITLPSMGTPHDCVLVEDQVRGYVNDYSNHAIWVLDLQTLDVDGGLNPVVVSIAPEDLTITQDRQWLIASGGSRADRVSVVNTAGRFEARTLDDVAIHSVEACSDDIVLATSTTDHELKRLVIDGTGRLTEYESLPCLNAFNAACAPGGGAGVLVDALANDVIASVLYPPLVEGQLRIASGSPVVAVVSPTGEEVFVRSSTAGAGVVEGYAFDSLTGAVGAAPFVTIPTTRAFTWYGVDQLAVHPGNRKVYVPEGDSLAVYDASNGARLSTLSHPNLVNAAGVCVTPNPGLFWDAKICAASNRFNCKRSTGTLPVTLIGGPDFDVTRIDISSLQLALDGDLSMTTGAPKNVGLPADTTSRAGIDSATCTPDGYADLKMDFRAVEIAAIIGCEALGKGDSSPPLVVRGTLLDGTPFIARNTQVLHNTAR